MYKKHKTKNIVAMALAVVLLVCACGALFGILRERSKAQVIVENNFEDQISLVGNGVYDKYTNTNKPNGVVIADYSSKRFTKNVETDFGRKMTKVFGDDDIVKIVPKELLHTPGKVLYIGKEYAFFVACEKVRYEFNEHDSFYSTVVIYDIMTETDLLNTVNHIKVGVKQVFQGGFVTVEKGDTKYCGKSVKKTRSETIEITENNSIYFSVNYSDQLLKDDSIQKVVLPSPLYLDNAVYYYGEYEEYMMNGFNFDAGIYNKNEPNPGDADYSAKDDNGAFFSEADFAYHGKSVVNGASVSNDVGKVGMNIGFTAYGLAEKQISEFAASMAKQINNPLFKKIPTEVAKAIPFVGTAISIIDLGASIQGICKDKQSTVVENGKTFTYTPFYNNKQLQIQNYGWLTKQLVASLNDEQGQEMLFGHGNSITFDFQVNTQDPLHDDVFVGGLSFSVVPVKHKAFSIDIGEKTTGFGYWSEKIKYDESYTQVPAIGNSKKITQANNNNIYILPDMDSYRSFVPSRTGNYSFDGGENPYSRFAIFEALDEKGEKRVVANLKCSYNGTPQNAIAQSQFVDGKSVVNNIELKKDKEYFIVADMQAKANQDGLNCRYGTIPLKTTYDLEYMNQGKQETISTYSLDVSYRGFIPQKDFIYTFCVEQAEKVLFRIEDMGDGKTVASSNDGALDVYLRGGVGYEIMFMNLTRDTMDIKADIYKCDEIKFNNGNPYAIVEDKTVENYAPQISNNKFVKFVPDFSGEYTYKMSSESLLGVSIYNSDFKKIVASNISKQHEEKLYFEKGKVYFFQINVYDAGGKPVEIGLKFSPKQAGSRKIYVDNIFEKYNVVSFNPQVSGEFNVETDVLTSKTVYNSNGEVHTSNQYEKGQSYYIVVSALENKAECLLSVKLDCDEVKHNQSYFAKKGDNTVMFIPQITGRYSFAGVDKYIICDIEYRALYDQNSDNRNLIAGETYLIAFASENMGQEVKMFFDPIKANETANMIISHETYYTLKVETESYYSISAKAFYKTAHIKVLNETLDVNTFGDAAVSVNLPTGKYYINIQIENIDTLVSVTSKEKLNQTTEIEFIETQKITKDIMFDQPMKIRYSYTKQTSSTKFFLDINEVLGENISVFCYYYEGESLKQLELNRTGKVGKYECVLKKEHGYYDFVVKIGSSSKQLTFDLYVPAVIQSVLIDDKNVLFYHNKLNLGIGTSYKLSAQCNDDASYKNVTTKLSENTNKKITLSENLLTVPNNSSLVGEKCEILFETQDGYSYRSYIFEIKKPYSAKGVIDNNIYQLNFTDVWDEKVPKDNVSVSKIDYYYCYAKNGKQYFLGTAQSAEQGCDLTNIPNVATIYVYAIINYASGVEESTDHLAFEEKVFRPTDSNFGDGARVLIDAQETLPTTKGIIAISNYTKVVNIRGNFNVTYEDITIVIAERSTPLVINVENFWYNSNGNIALDARGDFELSINISGSMKVSVTNKGKHAINAKNLTITGGALEVVGGDTFEGNEDAGDGMRVENKLVLNNLILDAKGGNGRKSVPSGGNGGNGIYCGYIILNSSSIKAQGGNGSNGKNGTSYTGQRQRNGSNGVGSEYIPGAEGEKGTDGRIGGHGCKGTSGGSGLTVLNSAKSFKSGDSHIQTSGGDGGTGGYGGDGEAGGHGGKGANTYSRKGSNDAGRGGNGGAGGHGGNGGDGGDPGIGTNYALADVNSRGKYGNGGNGGKGGNGGNGGNGGDDTLVSGEENSGGNGGQGGNGGLGGNGANPGSGGGRGTSGWYGYKGATGGSVAKGVSDGTRPSDGNPGSMGNCLI